MEVKLLTYAKVTLFLDVVRKREDEYHDIKILLHNIDLSDFLKIKLLPYPYFLLKSNLKIPEEENLVYKAYIKFVKETGIKIGCKIFLNKKIPIQAGLGGGSSNAAGVIYALNFLTKAKLSKEDMANISKDLGADIPFFFYGGSCLAEGKGEIIKKIPHNTFKFLLISPNFGISTKEIYSKIRKEDLREHIDFNSILYHYSKGILLKPFNFFENILFKIYPELEEIKKDLSEITPYTGVTGTGSTIFAVLQKDEIPESILEKYIKKGYKIKIIKSIDRGLRLIL
ncbi:MAG TPA: 4-(cytidine 5'-diphospho)-2-C-methyl-D-erythritol kinase [Dictyoglomaceae bacterium]|nr:4-(cytidine 5'-diphospho)-2-C-methyl-D-erythritol kinase [Dictyoglomaceae bacterium]HOL39135.1 4-(cytidine 5'-diphospho)-2-C-methyl-D-erythritol kinase [Dictyoglomaceae bacterium]HOP94256.1 4-(cytidine 5'-diphospho)-2-C-methyl-D-erythritol kinase [Dictyoglomaceae bacterium]HPP15289.1 4-(cytidine 5'-diphospho)-2-C-methyl-D-erythritol kinase [Dictyoglomaceae bacterium]HPU42695.1 4-(cytidine 5'-diphospho)-2-C-methyl-D-erythritol kinase [Dictyoglomaceae bacterium]